MTMEVAVTLQLRPHVAAMLAGMTARIKERLQGKPVRVTTSAIVRNLIRSGAVSDEATRYAIGERIDPDTGEVENLMKLRPGMAPYVQLRIRMGAEDVNRLQVLSATMRLATSRVLAALIVAAQKELPSDPDWELLDRADTRTPTTT